jgi:hypothetical protein
LENYDGEAELVKAKLGLKFKCAICGRIHDPAGKVWRRCLRKVEVYRNLADGKYRLYAWVPSVTRLRKGSAVLERAEKYYDVWLSVCDSEFELLTLPERVKERYECALRLQRAFNEVFREWCRKLPDIPLRVEEVYHRRGRISSLKVNGEPWPAYIVLSLFRCPTEYWDSCAPYPADGLYWYREYSICGVERKLRSVLVCRKDMGYKTIRRVKPVKRSIRYYLAYRDRFVEVSRSEAEARKGIYESLDDYFASSSSPTLSVGA